MVPTLLIWGANDRLFPQDYAFVYQQLIPGSKAVVLFECGHLPHVEKGTPSPPSSKPSSAQ